MRWKIAGHRSGSPRLWAAIPQGCHRPAPRKTGVASRARQRGGRAGPRADEITGVFGDRRAGLTVAERGVCPITGWGASPPFVAVTAEPGDAGRACEPRDQALSLEQQQSGEYRGQGSGDFGMGGPPLLEDLECPSEQDAGDEQKADGGDGDDHQIDQIIEADGNVAPGEGLDHRLGLKMDGLQLRREDDRCQEGQSAEVEGEEDDGDE